MPDEKQVSLLTKVSPRTLMGTKEEIRAMAEAHLRGLKEDEAPPPAPTVPLFQIYGMASEIVQGESSFGPWQGLIGRFEAVNLSTGEIFQGGKCFLPPVAHNLVAGEMAASEVETVGFGFEVGAKASTSTGSGYEYTAKTIVPPSDDDPLAVLRGRVQSAPALPAPKKS